jgi:hypothetical protein
VLVASHVQVVTRTKENVKSRVRHATVSCCTHKMAAQGFQHEIVSFLGYNAASAGTLFVTCRNKVHAPSSMV